MIEKAARRMIERKEKDLGHRPESEHLKKLREICNAESCPAENKGAAGDPLARLRQLAREHS
jgi:hypothetical protein